MTDLRPTRPVQPYYQDEYVTLYHGDCRDVLEGLPEKSIDLLLTDPPYGMAFGGFRGVEANVAADGARQGMRLVRTMLGSVAPLMKDDAHYLVFCHWESWPDFYDICSPYFPIKNALIWHKARGGMGNVEQEYARDYEVVLYGASGRRPFIGKRPCAVLTGVPPVPSAQRVHPTEKPVDLLAQFIGRHAPPAGCVIDPFAGGGSTLVAAKQLGRRAIGIEIDERHCASIASRLSQNVLDFGASA